MSAEAGPIRILSVDDHPVVRPKDLCASSLANKPPFVLGANEEDRRRDVVNGAQEPRSQLRERSKLYPVLERTTTARRFGSRSANSTVSEPPNESPIAATFRASTGSARRSLRPDRASLFSSNCRALPASCPYAADSLFITVRGVPDLHGYSHSDLH